MPQPQPQTGTLRQLSVKVLALVTLLAAVCHTMLEFTPYLRWLGHDRVLHVALHQAQQKVPSAKVVVFGDSVCRQLYGPKSYRGEVFSLATNFGVSLLGQRILMDLWLENNPVPRGRDLVLVLNPDSFANALDQKYTYNNLIKPFWRSPWRNRFDPLETDRIKAFDFHWLARFPFVRISNWCPSEIPSFADEPRFKEVHLSRLSIHELKKMEASARQHGVRLRLLAGVVSESNRARDFTLFKLQLKEAGLEPLFSEYFASARYLPDHLFVDEAGVRLHLKNPQALGRDALDLLKASAL